MEDHFSFGHLRATIDDVGKTFIITPYEDSHYGTLEQFLTDGRSTTHSIRTYALSDEFTANSWTPEHEESGASGSSETAERIRFDFLVPIFQNDLTGYDINEIRLFLESGSITVTEGETKVLLNVHMYLYGEKENGPSVKYDFAEDGEVSATFFAKRDTVFQTWTSNNLKDWELWGGPIQGPGGIVQRKTTIANDDKWFARITSKDSE